MQWTNQIKDKIWVPIEALSLGNQLEWILENFKQNKNRS
jgi:hypothetical protein